MPIPASSQVGQKQRVAVARPLVGDPRLVLADEPTADFDSQSGRAMVDLLQTLARRRGTTILLVTHDHRILDAADRIVTIEAGSSLAHGEHGRARGRESLVRVQRRCVVAGKRP